jgi:SOS-response transcriptional repressor LexA
VIISPATHLLDDLRPPISHYISKLRERQFDILRFVYKYTQEHGHSPTIREVGNAVGISSTSVVNYNINQLQKWGFLNRTGGTSRTILLTEAGCRVIDKHTPNDLNAEIVRLLLENRVLRERCQQLERMCATLGQGKELHLTSPY